MKKIISILLALSMLFSLNTVAFAAESGTTDELQIVEENGTRTVYVIDHTDNNITNHTVFNLSLMTETTNKQKSNIVAKVKLPVRLAVAYVDGKYRICMGTEVADFHHIGKLLSAQGISVAPIENTVAVLTFICEDADSLVNCLKYLATNDIEGCEGVKTKQGEWKDGVCLFEDVQKSIEAQMVLAQMEERMFNVFSAKTP